MYTAYIDICTYRVFYAQKGILEMGEWKATLIRRIRQFWYLIKSRLLESVSLVLEKNQKWSKKCHAASNLYPQANHHTVTSNDRRLQLKGEYSLESSHKSCTICIYKNHVMIFDLILLNKWPPYRSLGNLPISPSAILWGYLTENIPSQKKRIVFQSHHFSGCFFLPWGIVH